MHNPDTAENPEQQSGSSVNTAVHALHKAGIDVSAEQLAAEEGRAEAGLAVENRQINTIVALPADVKLPRDIALEQLRSLAARMRKTFAALRTDTNIQQMLSLLNFTAIGTIPAGIGSHLIARQEGAYFDQLMSDLDAFYKLLQDSGIDVHDLLPDMGTIDKTTRPGKSIITSLFAPWVRGFDRSVKTRRADTLKKDMETAFQRASDQLMDKVANRIAA